MILLVVLFWAFHRVVASNASCSDTPPFCDGFPPCSRACLGSADSNHAFAHSMGTDIAKICGAPDRVVDNWESIIKDAFACVAAACPSSALAQTSIDAQTAYDQYVEMCMQNGYVIDVVPSNYTSYRKWKECRKISRLIIVRCFIDSYYNLATFR
jgi:hypothetical protein